MNEINLDSIRSVCQCEKDFSRQYFDNEYVRTCTCMSRSVVSGVFPSPQKRCDEMHQFLSRYNLLVEEDEATQEIIIHILIPESFTNLRARGREGEREGERERGREGGREGERERERVSE